MGSRVSSKDPLKTHYILNVPKNLSAEFVKPVFERPEVLNGLWKVTRLDYQLTLSTSLRSSLSKDYFEGLLALFRALRDNQTKLEMDRANRPNSVRKAREVTLLEQGDFLRLRVGAVLSGINSFKIYWYFFIDESSSNDPMIRFEITVRSLDAFLNSLKTKGYKATVLEFFMSELLSVAESPLVSPHLRFCQNLLSDSLAQESSTPALEESTKAESNGEAQISIDTDALPVIAKRPSDNLETTFKWFLTSVLPALRKLVLNEPYASKVRKELLDIFENPESYCFEDVATPKGITDESPNEVSVTFTQETLDLKKNFNRPENF